MLSGLKNPLRGSHRSAARAPPIYARLLRGWPARDARKSAGASLAGDTPQEDYLNDVLGRAKIESGYRPARKLWSAAKVCDWICDCRTLELLLRHGVNASIADSRLCQRWREVHVGGCLGGLHRGGWISCGGIVARIVWLIFTSASDGCHCPRLSCRSVCIHSNTAMT